eukprot:RCo042001
MLRMLISMCALFCLFLSGMEPPRVVHALLFLSLHFVFSLLTFVAAAARAHVQEGNSASELEDFRPTIRRLFSVSEFSGKFFWACVSPFRHTSPLPRITWMEANRNSCLSLLSMAACWPRDLLPSSPISSIQYVLENADSGGLPSSDEALRLSISGEALRSCLLFHVVSVGRARRVLTVSWGPILSLNLCSTEALKWLQMLSSELPAKRTAGILLESSSCWLCSSFSVVRCTSCAFKYPHLEYFLPFACVVCSSLPPFTNATLDGAVRIFCVGKK